jgi:hypothetical protein
MDAKEAITVAKNWIRDILAEENVRNIGLEEVRREGDLWKITVGFSRPWDENRNLSVVLGGVPTISRTYKVITIQDSDGYVVSADNREPSR